jgi:ribosomal protein S18 acetylase RimI-like enzyme
MIAVGVNRHYKGQHIGKKLVELIIDEARFRTYTKMRLDTLDRLRPALTLYRQYGFREIAPYYDNPIPGVIYLEKTLI